MPDTTRSTELWLPRADAATLARKSQDTIRRIVERHQLETRTDAAGRVLVNTADLVTLGHLRQEDLTAGASPVESVEVLRARETITALRVQVGELTGRLAHADVLIAALSDQLTQKDRQLAKNADHLSQLIGRLGTLGGAA